MWFLKKWGRFLQLLLKVHDCFWGIRFCFFYWRLSCSWRRKRRGQTLLLSSHPLRQEIELSSRLARYLSREKFCIIRTLDYFFLWAARKGSCLNCLLTNCISQTHKCPLWEQCWFVLNKSFVESASSCIFVFLYYFIPFWIWLLQEGWRETVLLKNIFGVK